MAGRYRDILARILSGLLVAERPGMDLALPEACTRARSASMMWSGRYLELFLVH